MKKFIIGILCVFIICFVTSCSTENDSSGSINLYDVQTAIDLTGDFMKAIAEDNIEAANALLTDKTINSDEVTKLQENKIISYKKDEVIEGADYSYIRYLVVRGNDADVKAELDKIELKVIKTNDEYKVDEVNTKGMKSVYESSNTLRIRDEDTGKSNLLLRKKDLPTEVFPKSDEIVLTREDVESGSFGKLNIGFQGTSVAISLNGENEALIAVARVNESKETDGEAAGESSDVNADDGTEKVSEALEKPMAESIIGYDLIQNADIQKLLFTDDDGELIVQFQQQGKGSALRVYKNPKGDLNTMDLEELFPSDIYSVTVSKITGEGTYIKVEAIGEETAEEGDYIVDFKNMKITKE